MSFEVTLAATQLTSILATKGTLHSKVSEVFKAKSEKAIGMEPADITITRASKTVLEVMNRANLGKRMTIEWRVPAVVGPG